MQQQLLLHLQKGMRLIKVGFLSKQVRLKKLQFKETLNESVADINKQKLYVFLTLGGDYIAANFTGK